MLFNPPPFHWQEMSGNWFINFHPIFTHFQTVPTIKLACELWFLFLFLFTRVLSWVELSCYCCCCCCLHVYMWFYVQEVMKQPYIAADGFSYEREAIEAWMRSGHNTSPMTNLQLQHTRLTPNHTLRSLIEDWHYNRYWPLTMILFPSFFCSSFEFWSVPSSRMIIIFLLCVYRFSLVLEFDFTFVGSILRVFITLSITKKDLWQCKPWTLSLISCYFLLDVLNQFGQVVTCIIILWGYTEFQVWSYPWNSKRLKRICCNEV